MKDFWAEELQNRKKVNNTNRSFAYFYICNSVYNCVLL